MYFFFHLLTGIILGLVIADLFRDRRWLPACAIGAVLPDLIDKPLGYLILPSTLGYGRIYTHTLLLTILVLSLGIGFWKWKRNPGILGLGVGILSHQILDLMWVQPRDWYYPILGSFTRGVTEDYIGIMTLQELANPLEIAIAVLVGAAIMGVIFRHKIRRISLLDRKVRSVAGAAGALTLCILSGGVIGQGLVKHTIPIIGWGRPEELIIGGVVLALSAYVVWRWQK
jgi:membrane-bound metal-dependent hydrolase YbcI (DUF457 family)